MPFKSEAQRRYMHAAANRGEISQSVVNEFSAATPKNAVLPARVGGDTGGNLLFLAIGLGAGFYACRNLVK